MSLQRCDMKEGWWGLLGHEVEKEGWWGLLGHKVEKKAPRIDCQRNSKEKI
jgi:hypothetical protein